MKLWQKFLWGIVGIFIVGLLVVSCYGMGEDLLERLPLWLSKFMLGAMAFIIFVPIAVIFAMGLIKIKEIFKQGD